MMNHVSVEIVGSDGTAVSTWKQKQRQIEYNIRYRLTREETECP